MAALLAAPNRLGVLAGAAAPKEKPGVLAAAEAAPKAGAGAPNMIPPFHYGLQHRHAGKNDRRRGSCK